jgi:membrane-associated phospholipid phosphatase
VNLVWLAVAGGGFVILSASIAAAVRPEIPQWEKRVFHAVNGLPHWLHPILWLPMQLGNLVVGTALGLAIALAAGDASVAVGVVLAAALKLVAERVVRKRLRSKLEARVRPGASQTGAVLRGSDVPPAGPSFPSGHVILVAAISCVVDPLLPPGLLWLPFLLTALVMLGRVYVGAHNPLDATAGLGAGLVLGGVVAALVH